MTGGRTTGEERPVLQAVGLTVGYRRRGGDVPVLRGVRLTARAGELITLIGPNGAGKSTLLRTLAAAQPPLAGQVLLDGTDLTDLTPRHRARRLAVAFTDRVDAGMMSVGTVVGLGRMPHRSWLGRESARDRAAVDRALADAGVRHLRHRMLAGLSDGERQRVMIARALAQEPAVLVLDEPAAFLDVARRVELAAMLTRLTATTGVAIVLSTHDLGFALRRADQVWLVGAGGTVTADAPEDLAWGGAIARTFTGPDMAFDDASATVVVADDGPPGASVRVVAEGRLRQWAEHAVRRAGCTPTAEGGSRLLRFLPGAPCDWLLEETGTPGEPPVRGTGFAALVRHLRGSGAPSGAVARPHPPQR
ncbi:ABC transporter ATP-binding protein [Streptomyces sp. NPDC049881]|uniref:ABC transporter ATP-binding protein n=1 Tax=Streptomyces sp. NPDC049881 TaxID=3155778 RepID=UPI00343FC01E